MPSDTQNFRSDASGPLASPAVKMRLIAVMPESDAESEVRIFSMSRL
jgi:hypothetical protein